MKAGETFRNVDSGVLSGETPVAYRMVVELDPPLRSRKKQPTPSGKLERVELFTNDEDLFYWLQVLISRLQPEGTPKFSRCEAVKLAEGSAVTWTDQNPNEVD